MFKFFIGVIFVLVVAFFAVSTGSERVIASGGQEWIHTPIRVLSSSSVTTLPPNANTCYGMTLRIHIRSTGEAEACIFGEIGKTHLARYQGANYQYAYAIAIGNDTKYTRIENFCSGLAWCVYSSTTDTLLMNVPTSGWRYGSAIIKDFSTHLTKHTVPEPYYSFSYTEQYQTIGLNGPVIASGPTAVSSNGKWAAIELLEYGFVRMNMETGEYRRVALSGAMYGYGADPAFELAISNDGRYLTVTGRGSGITLYQIDGACGDILGDSTGRHFSQGVIACPLASIDYTALFPGYRYAQMPRFSYDGLKLTLYVITHTSVSRVTLTPLSSSETPTKPLYVALGDSFVSGEGETDDAYYLLGTNTETNRCHVSTRSYTYLLFPIATAQATNKACSGSRIEEVIEQNATISNSTHSQLPKYISVGVGGNDINVMGKLKTCISVGTCEWAQPVRRMQTAEEIQSLYPRIANLLQSLQLNNPQAQLFFVGYPKVINDSTAASCRQPLSLMLDVEERRYMNETIHYLNGVLSAAARSVGVPFIDIGTVYEGERLCDEKESAMNGIRIGNDFSPIGSLGAMKVIGAESFHPTPRGHELAAARIRELVQADGFGEVCGACSHAIPVPSQYWSVATVAPSLPRLIADTFLQAEAYVREGIVKLSLPAHSFHPHTIVKVELHSEAIHLGEFTANAEGALEAQITLPDAIEGYHTLHLIGMYPSGERIDRYDVAYIGLHPTKQSMHVANKALVSASSKLSHTADAVEVKGVSANKKVGSSASSRIVKEMESVNWFVIGGIGAGICLFSAVVAYSIGRRKV